MNLAIPANINSGAAQMPLVYENARKALSQCVDIDECKDWADKAAALASYARQAEDLELERMAARIRARAMRRAGELLKQIEPGQGARDGKREEGTHPPLRSEMARSAGMSPHQAKQAVRVANVPAEDFDRQVESKNPPTLTTLAQQGKQSRPAPNPETWLKGRDPAAFNKAMHFVADVDDYAKKLRAADLETILPNLDATQAGKVRDAIAVIDGIHDIIATRI